VFEATPLTIAFTAPSDSSSADTAACFLYSYDLDGDNVYEIAYVPAAAQTYLFQASGTRTIHGRITDKDGASRVFTVAVTVQDILPTIALSSSTTVQEGATYALTLGAVTDPGKEAISQYV